MGHTPITTRSSEQESRLDSWKAIAAHLGREVRTVQRWEKHEGLPVHRLQHARLGSVYAFASELEAWRRNRASIVPPAPVVAQPRATVSRAGAVVATLLIAMALCAVGFVAQARSASAASGERGTTSDQAWQSYKEGLYLLNRGDRQALTRSLTFFKDAQAIDPGFAHAHAGAAQAYAMLGRGGHRPPLEVFPQARSEALTALRLDEGCAEAHVGLALARFYWDWDWKAAEREFRRALALDPDLAAAHHGYAHFLSARGRHAEAIVEGLKAADLAPLSSAVVSDTGWFYYRARQFPQSLEHCRRALDLEPTFEGARMCVVSSLRGMGQDEAARAEALRFMAADHNSTAIAALQGDDPVAAFRRLQRLSLGSALARATHDYVAPYTFVSLYTGLDEPQHAFEWLERAFVERDRIVLLLRVHPMFDRLRSDARFVALTERVLSSPAPWRAARWTRPDPSRPGGTMSQGQAPAEPGP